MKGIIYIRVSSDEQVKGTSLEFQDENCRKYCQEKGIEVLEVFREEGESAKDLSMHNRKEFLRALEFCRKNKGGVQVFVVLRVDRFARNTDDHFAVRKILMDYGVTLHSVTEPIGNKPAEKLFETMLAGFAEFDNAIRKQRCSDGMSKKIDHGIYPWKSPYGYACAHFKKRGEKKTHPDPPDEKAFPLIQRGLKEFSKGLCSQTELTRMLDEWGLAKIRGKKTTIQFIDRVLGKYLKFYAGIIVNPWNGKEVEGLHKPMITKEEMYQIMLVRSGKAKMTKRQKRGSDFPLRRTITCGPCGRPLTGSVPRGNGGRYYYYHCGNKNCSMFGKGIPKLDLEKEFLKYLQKITPKDEFLKVFKETFLTLWQERGKRFELEAKQYETQIAELETKKKRICEMREDGSYTKEEFLERRQEIENQVAAVKISMAECRIDQFDIESALAYAITFLRDLGRQWFDLRPETRPRFQRLLFPDGIPYTRNKGFGTAKLSVIFELNQQSHGSKYHTVDLRGIEPRPHPCHGRVIPFYYRPAAVTSYSGCRFRLLQIKM